MGRKRKVAARNAKKGIDDPKQNRTKAQRKRQKVISPSFDVKHSHQLRKKPKPLVRRSVYLSWLINTATTLMKSLRTSIRFRTQPKTCFKPPSKLIIRSKLSVPNGKQPKSWVSQHTLVKKQHQAKTSKFERFKFRNLCLQKNYWKCGESLGFDKSIP